MEMASSLLRRQGVAISGLLLVYLAGCGSGKSTPPIVKVDEKNLFCTEVAAVLCYNMFKCCTGAIIEKTLGLEITTTEEACRRDVTLICQEKNYQVLNAISKGTVKVSGDLATTCLKSYLVEGDRCFVYSSQAPWTEPCKETIFEGLVAVGESCDSSIECMKDSYCAPDKKCKAYGQEGSPCGGQMCAEGLYCNPTTMKCASLLGENQTCSLDTQCAKDLFCDMKVTTPKVTTTCRRQVEVGSPCTKDKECLSTYCIPGICSGTMKSCYVKEDCGGKCETTLSSCQHDRDCGQGRCSQSGYSCSDDTSCYNPPGDTCVFPRKCELSVCEGNPVCGERFSLLDYCEKPLSLISTAPQPTP
jgi:hypothetical protein